MNNSPGESNVLPPNNGPHKSLSIFAGTSVAPMCCVIPPASLSITDDLDLFPNDLT